MSCSSQPHIRLIPPYGIRPPSATLIIIALINAFCPPALAADFHVAPGGSDANPGTFSKPFASLERARKAISQLRTLHSPLRTSNTVTVAAGIYPLTESLALNEQDSGTESTPVVWRAAGNGAVVLSGGIRIPPSALHVVMDPATLNRLPSNRDKTLTLYEIRLADLGQTNFPPLTAHGMPTPYLAAWPELFLDGTPLPLSCWPNGTGYANGFKPTKTISSGTAGKNSTMVFAFKNKRAVRWKSAMESFKAEPWMGGHWFWDWADDFLPVSGIADGGVITIGRRHGYGMGSHVNLHIYNLAEEMDAPGEYSIEPSRSRILVLLSARQSKGSLTLSWLGTPLIKLQNCSHIRFTGIRFSNSRADAASLTGVDDIIFSRCTFDNLGRNGITALGTRVTVEDCLFSHIGAIGASLNGGDRKTLTASHNRVTHCEFSDFSRVKRTYAPGVFLGGVGSTVENSLFHGSPHTAILFGGNEHLIRSNEIHTVLTETGDCGAIYGGRDWTAFGTVISGNWIHDLGGLSGRWPCAIYLDDALSGIFVKNNLVERVSLGILVGGGRYNTVTGNIFNRCEEGMHLDSRGIGWMSNRLDTLKKRLAEMPVDQAPWTTRYPMLKNTLQNAPGKPVGTRMTGNATVACQKAWKAKSPAGVATVAPNWENVRGLKLVEKGKKVHLIGTPLEIIKPEVGVRR